MKKVIVYCISILFFLSFTLKSYATSPTQALQLTASNHERVSFGNSSVFNFSSGDFTVEANVYLNSYQNYASFLSNVAPYGGNGWTLQQDVNGKVGFEAKEGDQGPFFESSSALDLHTWYHIAVSYDSNAQTYRMFINGTQVGEMDNTPNPTTGTATNLEVGRYNSDNTYVFDGDIQNVRLSNVNRYPSAFTPSTQLFTPDGNTALLAYFNGDLNDYSGNNYNGTFGADSGTPTYVTGNLTGIATLDVSPSTKTLTVGTPISVDIYANGAAQMFNAAQATVTVSSNLSVTGLQNPTTNACNFQYTQAPTTSNLSFAGAIYGSSSKNCKVYTLTLTPTSTGSGTVTITNGSIKSYTDSAELFTGVQNGSFTINAGPTPTPTTALDFTITNPLQTYNASFNLTGTKLATITHIFVNGSDSNSTYPTSTTWQATEALSLGDNTFTLYGSDGTNQTATQTVDVNRHTIGDINGDGVVDLTDASLFAVDWGKTSNLTYNLSDMNNDGTADLTDLSILAKLEQ